jgi:hypothetical protein
VSVSVPWIAHFAATRGFRYEPDADERWMRVWEPFATLRVPIRYEHALSATGDIGSITLSTIVQEVPAPHLHSGKREVAAWLAIVQDERIKGKFAITSDRHLLFGEPLDLVSMQRQSGGDAWFDGIFATFGQTQEAVTEALTPSLKKLVMGWQTPLHAEVRPGGFVLCAVALPPDHAGLAWLADATTQFGAKATKVRAPA